MLGLDHVKDLAQHPPKFPMFESAHNLLLLLKVEREYQMNPLDSFCLPF